MSSQQEDRKDPNRSQTNLVPKTGANDKKNIQMYPIA